MSTWRREASERLPELQHIIASRDVESPMMLWIELNAEFERMCSQTPAPIELIRRLWGYCKWCLKHPDETVQTAAALAFCEHLLDSPARIAVLPKMIGREEFLGMRSLLEYHHTADKIDECLKTLWG